MARQQANKGDKGGLVSRSSMERIGRAVAAYERGNRSRKPQAMPRAGDDEPVRIGKTTEQWLKGTLSQIELWEEGVPPDEAKATPPIVLYDCVNRFATVAAGKWVAVAQGVNGYYYLISAEC